MELTALWNVMPRDTILFDINETVLDLVSLRPRFESQISNAGLSEHFDEIVSVEETGSFKPDAQVHRFVAAGDCCASLTAGK